MLRTKHPNKALEKIVYCGLNHSNKYNNENVSKVHEEIADDKYQNW